MNIRKSLGKGGENQKKMTTQEGCEFKSSLRTSPTSQQKKDMMRFEDYRSKEWITCGPPRKLAFMNNTKFQILLKTQTILPSQIEG
jgi:hypothetical protein